jgi:hypothetical protein
MKTSRLSKQAWSLGTVPEEISAANNNGELLQDLLSDSTMKQNIHDATTKEDTGVDSSTLMDSSFITLALLPCLLFIQFGMAFYLHDKSTSSLSWPLVNLAIVLYVAAVWIYRQACVDFNIGSLVMLLLPELLMDIVLALVLFNRVVLALATLLSSTMLLSSFVIFTMIRYLLSPWTQPRQVMSGGYDRALLEI